MLFASLTRILITYAMILIYQLLCSDFVEALLKIITCRPKPGQPDKRADSIHAPSISFFEDLLYPAPFVFHDITY